jgi:hypothetical protein
VPKSITDDYVLLTFVDSDKHLVNSNL